MVEENNYNMVFFCNDYVGKKVLRYIIQNFREDLASVVLLNKDSKIYRYLLDVEFPEDLIYWHKSIYEESVIRTFRSHNIHNIILAWWPKIIKEPLLSIPSRGIINFHPSYLPYNRGKDPNFWSIVEETPFGVSLQIIDETIDGGDIIFQSKIKKDWEDTGKSLYFKARKEIINLFVNNYEKIRLGQFERKEQNLEMGTFHKRSELEPASQIDLEKRYKAKDLLNLLRARTFPPHPGCYFFDNGKKFEITIDITEISNGSS